jgi:predicted dienelactone hydrolase
MSNGVRTICQLALAGLFVVESAGLASAQSPPLWGKLSPGSYGVGFRTVWQLDYSRRYNTTFDDKTTYATGKAPRPILINIWYPAKAAGSAKTMRHRDYLDMRSADPSLAKFSGALAEYELGLYTQELQGEPGKGSADRGKHLLDELLNAPTPCVRDAAAAEGQFPLVIYHAGYGSTFDDNSVLCEFLASHGYVVFGSAFQEPSGASLNVDGKQTSARDMQFLIGYAKQLPNADWHHVGVIGHSGGAHATLMYRAQADCAADAVVSLDTTQDYYSAADLRWEELSTTVGKNRKNITGPLLMVANPHAYFQLADSLSLARRYYLTIKDLDHNNFVSQSSMTGELRHRLRFPTTARAGGGPPNAEEVKERTRLTAVKSAYEFLCDYVLHFLDAELKGDAAGKEFVTTRYRDTPLTGAAPHVEYVPPGVTGAEPYAENSSQPPTPRQVRDFLRKHGSAKTVALFRQFQKEAPTQPIYHQIFGWALVGDLLDQGKTQDAIAVRDYYHEFGVDFSERFLEWGQIFLRMGRKELATDCFKKVLLLDPSNREAADKMKEATGSK